MSNTFVTIIIIGLTAILMFTIPIMLTANQNDSISQTQLQEIVSDFVNNTAKEGKITQKSLEEFEEKIYAIAPSADIQLTVLIFDDNPGKKGQNIKVNGENLTYSIFDNEIRKQVEDNGELVIQQGGTIKAYVCCEDTDGAKFRKVVYKIVGKNSIVMEASASALVTTPEK